MSSYLSSYHELCVENPVENTDFSLFINGIKRETVLRHQENNVSYFAIDGNDELLGQEIVVERDGKKEHVDVTRLALLSNFDEIYGSDIELGPLCEDNQTVFRLWSPFTSKVTLLLKEQRIECKRLDHGIYEAIVQGDLDGELYQYEIIINGVTKLINDPYAKSSNANSEKSAVINLGRLSKSFVNRQLKPITNHLQSVIYETHIRDFTINSSSNIEHKGKYAGFIEKNRQTTGKNPVGIDYLNFISVSHVQLLPVLDFGSVNEFSPKEYNWGYDPVSFFALEGSYSINPDDPHERMKEFRALVDTLHEENIRVNLDVVYNHLYKAPNTNLYQLAPHYFFREENRKLANHSWCGNDFASERKMARRLIIDSINFLLNFYDVDGFRFDLMGLIDLETIREVVGLVHNQKKDAMVYGEGWDMYAQGFKGEKMATMKNSHELLDVSFFNDSYRDIIRGHGSHAKLDENGYVLGNLSYQEGFKFAYLGSCSNITYPALFTNPEQSINYVECHDNATLYDVISESTDNLDPLRMVKLFNKVIMCSVGIPFIHMGQEIGLSKHNQRNTYNMGDHYNAFDFCMLDERFDMAQSFRHYVHARQHGDYLNFENVPQMLANVSFTNPKDGIVIATWNGEKSYRFVFNMTKDLFILDNTDEFYNFSDTKLRIMKKSFEIVPFRCSYLLKD